jgi:small subunit ribosomal protein S8
MSRTDLVADVFAMMRNAIMAHKENVDVPASSNLKAIMEILKQANYIDTYKVIEDDRQGTLRVYLKYISGKSAIRNLQRVSRPGLRTYLKRDKIPLVLRGKGMAIISTSKGVVTDQQAREMGLGGEVIASIW